MPRVVRAPSSTRRSNGCGRCCATSMVMNAWHPIVAKSTIERGYPSDKIGCVRRFTMQDGAELREQLLALSDLEMTFSYRLLETPIPLFNYVAHVRLLPVTDGNRSFWHWEGRFTTPGRARDGARRARRQRSLFKRDRGGPPVARTRKLGNAMPVNVRIVQGYRKPLVSSPAIVAHSCSAAARCWCAPSTRAR